MPERLLPFLGVVAVITLIPGPDMALVLRNGMRGGATAAWATGLGCCAGIAMWAVTSVAGVAALLAATGRAFDVLRIAGAVYLALLGLGALRSALGGGGPPVAGLGPATAAGEPPAIDRRTAFRQGLVSNLLNPKIALLFLTLLPQFVAPGEARTATTAELGLAFLLVGLTWMRLVSLALAAIGRGLARPVVRRTIEGVAGTVLVGLAVRVALDR
jgi:threonine/homoserine/homoserine lactone efflux protein